MSSFCVRRTGPAGACLLALLTLPGVSRGDGTPAAAVVALLDVSGPMGGRPLEQAVAATSLFIAGCDGSLEPGVITFDSRVRVLTQDLGPATAPRRKAILAALQGVRAEGQTDLLGGLLAALKLL